MQKCANVVINVFVSVKTVTENALTLASLHQVDANHARRIHAIAVRMPNAVVIVNASEINNLFKLASF